MQQYKSIIIGSALLMCAGFSYADKKVLTVAAYPAVDQIVKDSLAVWSKNKKSKQVKQESIYKVEEWCIRSHVFSYQITFLLFS